MDLNDAIAELQGKGDWFADEFEDFDERLRSPLATILNAAASGQLLPLETCNARVAAMVEEAAADCDRMAGEIADAVLTGLPEQARIREGMESAFTKAAARIRTLVTADHTAALDAMISRAREEALAPIRDAVTQYHLALDRHDNGNIAGYRLQDAVQKLLGMPWRQGAVLRANATDASEGER